MPATCGANACTTATVARIWSAAPTTRRPSSRTAAIPRPIGGTGPPFSTVNVTINKPPRPPLPSWTPGLADTPAQDIPRLVRSGILLEAPAERFVQSCHILKPQQLQAHHGLLGRVERALRIQHRQKTIDSAPEPQLREV